MSFKISLCDDGIFRGIFGQESSAPFLTNLVNAVLRNADDTQIQTLEIKNPFQLKDLVLQKESILDIKAKDNFERWFDIEIQIVNHENFRERVLYYWAKTYSRELDEGNPYQDLRPVVGVVFTKFPIWPDHPETLFDTFHLCSKNHSMRIYSDHIKLHFITVPDRLDNSKCPLQDVELRHWLTLLNFPDKTSEEEMENISAQNPQIKAAYERTKTFLAEPDVREYMEAKLKFERDQESIRQTIAHESLAKGRMEGLAKGRMEGLAKGREEGREKGRMEQAITALLQVIEWNIGEPSEHLRHKLENLTDLNKINALYEKVVKRQLGSLGELENELP